MYLVTIINNGVETAINEVSTSTDNRISGTIKQGINTINSFTFTILPNNIGYSLINPLSTLVKVLNTKTNKYEFVGRVLSPTHSMNSNGLISKSYVCESELGYLLDTYQSYEELHNITVKGYLERLIQAHNNNTDSSKKFVVGNVTVVDNNDSLYRYIAYDTTKKNIYDDLIDKLGGELQIRYENDIRYLDYLTEVGRVCSTEIRLAKNLQDLEQNIDVSEYCNRLVVLGAKLKTKDDEGNEEEVEERLTIESINNGIKYIDDKESIAKYGVIQGQVIYDDVTEAKNLLSKGQKHLLNQRLSVSNKVNALDLSLIGIDIDSFEVGNYYPLIHEILGINDVVRVVEKSISIDSPHANSITLGDLEKDIKKYNIQAKKGYTEAIKLAQENKLNISKVEKYATDEIYRVDDRINEATVNINEEIKELKLNKNSIIVTNESELEQAFLKGGNIVVTKSFSITKSYLIKSNTYMSMNDGISIKFTNGAKFLTDSNENTTKYNGAKNIKFVNCCFKGDVSSAKYGNMIALFHANNIVFKNVTFKNINGSHAIDICGSKNVRIINCNFMGYITDPEGTFREAIQLDIANANAMPYFNSNSNCYDFTVSKDIYIDNCYFGASGDKGTIPVLNAIGQHSQTATSERIDNIHITNNKFYGNNNITSQGDECSYGQAIKLVQCSNVTVSNNIISNYAMGVVLDIFAFVRTNQKPSDEDDAKKEITKEYGTGCVNINITNNTINCGTGATQQGIRVNVSNGLLVEHNKHKNVIISNNVINNIPSNAYGIYLEDIDNCIVDANIYNSNNSCIAIKINETNTSNIKNTDNNLVCGSVSLS